MITIDNLTFTYPGRHNPTIGNLSLQLPEGSVYGLLGRNGVGKSTLLYLIAGLLTPNTGRIEFDGIDTRRRLPPPPRFSLCRKNSLCPKYRSVTMLQ